MWRLLSNNAVNRGFFQCKLLLQPFNGLFSRTTWISRYQKGKTNLDFIGARDSEWQWHQLGPKLICTLLQADNHASTPPLCFLQAGCPSCRPTNSVKALKAQRQSTEGTAQNKIDKYSKLASTHIFYPFAIETAGTCHEMAIKLT